MNSLFFLLALLFAITQAFPVNNVVTLAKHTPVGPGAEVAGDSIKYSTAPPSRASDAPPAPDVAVVQAAPPADPIRPPQAVPSPPTRTDSDITVDGENGENGESAPAPSAPRPPQVVDIGLASLTPPVLKGPDAPAADLVQAAKDAQKAYQSFNSKPGHGRSQLNAKIMGATEDKDDARLATLNDMLTEYKRLLTEMEKANQKSVKPEQLELHGYSNIEVHEAIKKRMKMIPLTAEAPTLELLTGKNPTRAEQEKTQTVGLPTTWGLTMDYLRKKYVGCAGSSKIYKCGDLPEKNGFVITKL
jgi:hypothetical protein